MDRSPQLSKTIYDKDITSSRFCGGKIVNACADKALDEGILPASCGKIRLGEENRLRMWYNFL